MADAKGWDPHRMEAKKEDRPLQAISYRAGVENTSVNNATMFLKLTNYSFLFQKFSIFHLFRNELFCS